MGRIDELAQAHDALVDSVRNLRADLIAQRMLCDAMLVAMTPAARSALEHNFKELSERWIAGMLARSTDPSDKGLHAAQRAIEHVGMRLRELPRS